MIEMVAEVGINANGSIDIARKLIDVAATAGCHFIKFQKRTIDLVYTPEELATPRESQWGNTFGDQKKGLEFDESDYMALYDYATIRGLELFVSVWDIGSVGFAAEFDFPFIKIPSALITNHQLLQAVKSTKIPVIISTGMSTMEIIDDTVKSLGEENIHCIMHCTSTYPSGPDEQNLECILTYKERYPWAKIGFSNHSPGLPYMLAAAAMGAKMIEFHVTLDRSMYGSDQAASIEPEGVYRICKWIRGLEEARGDGKKKIYDSEIPIMKKLRR